MDSLQVGLHSEVSGMESEKAIYDFMYLRCVNIIMFNINSLQVGLHGTVLGMESEEAIYDSVYLHCISRNMNSLEVGLHGTVSGMEPEKAIYDLCIYTALARMRTAYKFHRPTVPAVVSYEPSWEINLVSAMQHGISNQQFVVEQQKH